MRQVHRLRQAARQAEFIGNYHRARLIWEQVDMIRARHARTAIRIVGVTILSMTILLLIGTYGLR